MTATRDLSLNEGVLLAHALVQSVAESNNIRAFFVKGPASFYQGIRVKRDVADVDVFVEPDGCSRLVEALEQKNWIQRTSDPDISAFPRHSITLYHECWPNDIDVHYRFPGMDRDARDSFDEVWGETTFVELAGAKIRVPTPPLGICFIVLHALRNPWAEKSEIDLHHIKSLDLSVHREALMRMVKATSCAGAIMPFLRDAYGDVPELQSLNFISDEWKRRTSARAPGSARIMALIDAPWKKKPLIAVRAILPSRSGLLAKNRSADTSFGALLLESVGRWRSLIASIPAVVMDVKRYLNRR